MGTAPDYPGGAGGGAPNWPWGFGGEAPESPESWPPLTADSQLEKGTFRDSSRRIQVSNFGGWLSGDGLQGTATASPTRIPLWPVLSAGIDGGLRMVHLGGRWCPAPSPGTAGRGHS
ncbi:hypothetical protein GCM10027262_36690 [Nocardia tengchongensis]